MFEQLTYKERVNTVAEMIKAQLGTKIEGKDLEKVKETSIAWEVPYEAVLAVIADEEVTTRLEKEVKMMLNECSIVYASKDTNKVNAWLELNYHPFRKFWINKVGEDLFAETWNRLNRASK